jgi:transposase
MHAAGASVRTIARTLGIARNSVRKYLRAPEVPKPPPRPQRGSKLDPYSDYLHEQLARGVDNCVVLLRELRAQGYDGSYTLLKSFVQPLRRRRQPVATMRFETTPGDQAQVDWGTFRYQTADGSTKTIYPSCSC